MREGPGDDRDAACDKKGEGYATQGETEVFCGELGSEDCHFSASEISPDPDCHCISGVLQAGNRGWDRRVCKDFLSRPGSRDRLKIALCLRRVKNASADWRISEILEK